MFQTDKFKTATALEKEIATYIMNNLPRVSYMRVRELAEVTHVSAATIIRFTQKMGYGSFPELRVALKQELTKQKKILENEQGNRSLLQKNIFPANFKQKTEELLTKLVSADCIHCIGMGASGLMAKYAAHQFSTLGYRSFASTATYFPYLAPQKKLTKNDQEVCLFFSVSGETIELVHMAEAIANSAIYSVSVTNQELNSLAQQTDLQLFYETSYDRVYYNADLSSQLPVVYLIEHLIKNLYYYNQQVED